MSYEKTHPMYAAHLPEWQRIRACCAGGDAVKEAGERYLPKPGGLTDKEYAAYKDRALFFGATGRTVDGLLGAMFRKDPSITLPDNMAYLLSNADGAGTSLNVFLRSVAKEVLTMGRHGLLTEIDRFGNPYLVSYAAENIRNWRETSEDQTVVDQVILREIHTVPAPDGFGATYEERYRVLELEGGQYIQTVYGAAGSQGIREEPVVRGRALGYIPFTFVGSDNLSPAVGKSPVSELSAVNISHYVTQADLEHAAHWTGLPTLVVIGASDENTSLRVGSSEAVLLPPGGDMKFVEFTGAGLSVLSERAAAKESYMVLLGARLLEEQKKAAETAESKRLQYSGENSILAQIANLVSEAVTRNLVYAYKIITNSDADVGADTVSVSLNTDFFDAKLTSDQATAIVSLYQNGLMSQRSAVWNLQQGEVLPPDTTVEAEIDAIETTPPAV
jgi:hypothetical protein